MQDIICAICGINQQTRILYKPNFSKKSLNSKTFSARREPDRIHYQLNECKKCGLIFSSPIFSSSKIDKFYGQSYCSYPSQIDFLNKTYLELVNNRKQNISYNARVLEIGCGDGFFLNELRNNGYKKLYGVEPSKKMVLSMPMVLRKNVKISTFKKGLFKKNYFDLVTCFHTLDHVTDPNLVLLETYSILQEKGIAIFVLHNTDALSVKLFRERSPIFDIEHIYLFNQKNVSKIFKKNGFHILEVSNLRNTYPLAYWIQMAGIPQLLKTGSKKFAKMFGLSNVNVSLKGGNMFVIAQKK